MTIIDAVNMHVANYYVIDVPFIVIIGASIDIESVAFIFILPFESISKVHPFLVILSVIDNLTMPSVGDML